MEQSRLLLELAKVKLKAIYTLIYALIAPAVLSPQNTYTLISLTLQVLGAAEPVACGGFSG